MFLPLQFYTISSIINFLTSGFLGVLLLVNSRSVKPNRIFGYFCFSVAFWSLFYAIWTMSESKSLAEFYLRTCMLGVIFMPTLFFHFVVSFFKIKQLCKYISLNYFLSIFFSVFVYTPFYAENPNQFLVFPYWLNARILCHLEIFHFVTVV